MVLIFLLFYGYNMYIVQIEERCNLLAYRGVHTKEGKRIMQQTQDFQIQACTAHRYVTDGFGKYNQQEEYTDSTNLGKNLRCIRNINRTVFCRRRYAA